MSSPVSPAGSPTAPPTSPQQAAAAPQPQPSPDVAAVFARILKMNQVAAAPPQGGWGPSHRYGKGSC